MLFTDGRLLLRVLRCKQKGPGDASGGEQSGTHGNERKPQRPPLRSDDGGMSNEAETGIRHR
jgi:hypothetical protein